MQIGNSEGLTLPKKVREETGLRKGVRYDIAVTPDKSVVISKVGKSRTVTSVTPDFLETLEGVNKRYGPALKRLAKL